MSKINDLISKLKGKPKQEGDSEANNAESTTKKSSAGKSVKTWYQERYDSMVVQRNLLFMLLLLMIVLSIIAVASTAYINNTKKFDPFVIQIDDSTGMAKIVTPVSSTVLKGNEALAQYLIKKYVIARETYNPVDFDTEAKKIVRLLSSNAVYWQYRGYLKNDKVNPAVKYAKKNTTYLLVKSWSKLSDNKYILRFSINETMRSKQVFNKIAVVDFQYTNMELTEDQKDINPVGFQVTGYRVDDDNS